MISQDALNAIKDRLVGAFHPERIIMFGSQARGTADARSDVDLLVVCPFTGQRHQLMVEMNRALDQFDYAFDILILTPQEWQRDQAIPGTIGRYAFREGKLLYELH